MDAPDAYKGFGVEGQVTWSACSGRQCCDDVSEGTRPAQPVLLGYLLLLSCGTTTTQLVDVRLSDVSTTSASTVYERPSPIASRSARRGATGGLSASADGGDDEQEPTILSGRSISHDRVRGHTETQNVNDSTATGRQATNGTRRRAAVDVCGWCMGARGADHAAGWPDGWTIIT